MTTEARTEVMCPLAKKQMGPLEAGKSKEKSPLGAFRGRVAL